MAAPYIPPILADFALWAQNFSDKLTADPPLYGVSSADAAAVAVANADFQAAFIVSTTISTRTKDTVNTTNTLRASLTSLARTLAAQISINPGVDSSDKIALGLNLPNHTPSPIPPPSTNPIISFLGATPGQHTLTFADSATPLKRAKPQGVIAMQLFVGIAVDPIADPDNTKFYAQVTANPVAVTFGPSDAGKTATYFGRWINRGKVLHTSIAPVGPWSDPTSAVIP